MSISVRVRNDHLLMPRRPDWNRIGPRLPVWFRPALRRIDKRLVLQYLPPDWLDSRGVNSREFPMGTWAICRRMGRTGRLWGRWFWNLTNPLGMYSPPTGETLCLLRIAARCWRRGGMAVLEREFDESVARMKAERGAAGKALIRKRVEAALSRIGQRVGSGVSVLNPGMPA